MFLSLFDHSNTHSYSTQLLQPPSPPILLFGAVYRHVPLETYYLVQLLNLFKTPLQPFFWPTFQTSWYFFTFLGGRVNILLRGEGDLKV